MFKSAALRHSRANSGITFRPAADCILWLPGQSDPYSSILKDHSGFGHDATISGATWTQNDMGLWGLSYDGVTDWGEIASTTALENVGDTITVMAWIKMASTGQNAKSFVMKTSASPFYSYGLQITSFRISFVCNVGGVAKIARGNADPYTSLDWQFHVGRYDGAEIAAFVNGVKQTTVVATTGDLTTDSNVLSLGSWKRTSERPACEMQLSRVINRAISDDEIRSIRRNERGLFGV